MTDDYKNDLIDYITGNLSIEDKKNISFKSSIDLFTYLGEKLEELDIIPIRYKLLTSEITSNFLVYGTYEKDNKDQSYIVVLDENCTIKKIILTYESGVLLEPIDTLSYDENGNIYGIDIPNNQSYLRVILLNNIALPVNDDYICKLRASYYIRNSNFVNGSINRIAGTSYIKKLNGESTYYIFGRTTNNTMLIKFVINVGAENMWEYYTGESLVNKNLYFSDFIIEKENNTEVINIYYITNRDSSGRLLNHEYFDGTNMNTLTSYGFDEFISDIRIENSTSVYLIGYLGDGTKTNIYYLKNGFINLIHTKNTYLDFIIKPSYIELVDGILFYKIVEEDDTYARITPGVYYEGEIIEPSFISMFKQGLILSNCVIQKNFALYRMIILSKVFTYRPTVVIYDNQYSGASYINYDSLIPLHAQLYSFKNSIYYIEFARTLYNTLYYQNETLATLNVPNNYLNNVEIASSNLLSSTMTELCINNDTITKNIYENLYINFLNRIDVIDEDTSILYKDTANYITENTNTGTKTNYDNTKLTKVRINYTTPQIQNINWVWNVDHYETKFTIYTEEIPSSIEFISNDETTTYLTKQLEGLETNKYYTISQKLRIE